jgi:hypothetical protein
MSCSVADIRVDCCRSLGDNSLRLLKEETTGRSESWPERTGGVCGETPHVLTKAGFRLALSWSAVEEACWRKYSDPRSAILSKDVQLPDDIHIAERRSLGFFRDGEESPWRWSIHPFFGSRRMLDHCFADSKDRQSAARCCTLQFLREVKWLYNSK